MSDDRGLNICRKSEVTWSRFPHSVTWFNSQCRGLMRHDPDSVPDWSLTNMVRAEGTVAVVDVRPFLCLSKGTSWRDVLEKCYRGETTSCRQAGTNAYHVITHWKQLVQCVVMTVVSVLVLWTVMEEDDLTASVSEKHESPAVLCSPTHVDPTTNWG